MHEYYYIFILIAGALLAIANLALLATGCTVALTCPDDHAEDREEIQNEEECDYG